MWVDQIKARELQKAGKVYCVLSEYDENLSAKNNNPIAKRPLQWLLDAF